MSGICKKSFNAEAVALMLFLPMAFVPVVTDNLFVYSLTNQVLIGMMAAFSVYIMLRLDLLSFAVPAFMAIGGYAAALSAKGGLTDLVLLVAVSFVTPAVLAVGLGSLVLRLKGVYFVLVTFVFTEILQLSLFEAEPLTNGANGIAGVPSATFMAASLSSNRAVVCMTLAIGALATMITALVTGHFRREFAAIEKNETLAESLGLAIWLYRTIGFVTAAGIAGMSGFALVNMLLTAHPSSFSSFSSVNYIAYAIVGGRRSILGPMLGAALLVLASNLFSSQAEYSPALFGMLIVAVVIVTPGGIIELLQRALRLIGESPHRRLLSVLPALGRRGTT